MTTHCSLKPDVMMDPIICHNIVNSSTLIVVISVSLANFLLSILSVSNLLQSSA